MFPKRRKTRILTLVVTFFTSITLLALGSSVEYSLLTEDLFIRQNLHQKFDCAIVLSGDFSEEGSIGDETCRRCSHALNLYNQKRIRKIICSGGYRPWRTETTAQQAVRWLKAHHIPENALYAENKSCNTTLNLQKSLTIAKNLGCQNISIISSSTHLFRVQRLLNDINMPSATKVYFEPYPTAETYPKIGFFTLVKQVHYEWISFALYGILPHTWYNQLVFYLRGCS